MPELPEVETCVRGIEPHLVNQCIDRITIKNNRLRWLVPIDLPALFQGATIQAVWRRGKFILVDFAIGQLIFHLGMSGTLRVLESTTPTKKHDHIDIELGSGFCLRYNDPRRFGALLYQLKGQPEHKLLATLGVEPLETSFTTEYLYSKVTQKKIVIKKLLMNSRIVVGVGNIYANEALFLAGILPMRQAGSLTIQECKLLVDSIKQVLQKAIEAGGTTLKDFLNAEGKPGYFRHELQVYGRADQPCYFCGQPLILDRIDQRQTVYCNQCQR